MQRGHVIVLYATGAGQTTPESVDGQQTVPPTLPKPIGGVSVMIGGQNAQINYAGAAPYLVAGAIQVNAVVPTGVTPGTTVPFDLNYQWKCKRRLREQFRNHRGEMKEVLRP